MAISRQTALPLAAAAATFLAVSPCLRAYQVPGAALFVAVAAVASPAITFAIVRYWRQRPVVSYSLSLVGLAIVMFTGTGLHPTGVVRSAAQGPNRLLTETLPLTGSRSTVVALVILTWICGAATAELLSRQHSSRLGLVVPLACYVLTYSVSASAPGRGLVAGPLLFVVIGGMALVRQHEAQSSTRLVGAPSSGESDSRPPRFRRAATGAAAVLAVTAVVAVVVPALPGMSRPPASLHRTAPTLAGNVIDPVDAMADLRDGSPRAAPTLMLNIDLDRPSTGYLALAILDVYDGVLWRFDSTFEPTGGRIPSSLDVGTTPDLAGRKVRQRITVERPLPVSLLPALDRTSEVTGLPVVADPDTAMILPSEGLRGSFGYTAWSTPPAVTLADTPSVDGIGEAASSSGSSLSSDLALPPDTTAAMATTMRFLTTLTGERPVPTVAFLQALMATLHTQERRVDPQIETQVSPNPTTAVKSSKTSRQVSASQSSAPTTTVGPGSNKAIGGTSLSEVINAVTVDRSATPEQFATLYAMVARYLGVPARVVTGFRLASTSTGEPIAAGSYQVTSRQAWAWVEIPVAGIGWVVADPTPDAVTAPGTVPSAQVQTSPTTVSPRQANAVPQNEITGGHALAKPSHITVPKSLHTPAWLVVLLVFMGLVVVGVVAGPGLAVWRRAWRRRSRKAEDPSELVVGAWLELLDGLNQAGMAVSPGSTSSEVATEAGSHFGPDVVDPVRHVGALADQALYSSREPPDLVSAAEAWTTQRALRRHVHSSLDRRLRVRALLTVGSSPRRPLASGERE